MVWARATDQFTLVETTPVNVNMLAAFETAYGADLIGSTVVRVRGTVSVSNSLSTDPTIGNMRMAARIMALEDATPATGGGDPFTSPHADWFLWEPFQSAVRTGVSDANAASFGTNVSARLIDVRAQRKVDELADAPILWFASAPVTPDMQITYDLSVLVKLP